MYVLMQRQTGRWGSWAAVAAKNLTPLQEDYFFTPSKLDQSGASKIKKRLQSGTKHALLDFLEDVLEISMQLDIFQEAGDSKIGSHFKNKYNTLLCLVYFINNINIPEISSDYCLNIF